MFTLFIGYLSPASEAYKEATIEMATTLQAANPDSIVKALPFRSAAHLFNEIKGGLLYYAIIDSNDEEAMTEAQQRGIIRYPRKLCSSPNYQIFKKEMRKHPRIPVYDLTATERIPDSQECSSMTTESY